MVDKNVQFENHFQAELDALMANPVVAGATNKDAFWIGIVEKNKVSIGIDGSDVVTNYGPNEPNDKTGTVCCSRLLANYTVLAKRSRTSN